MNRRISLLLVPAAVGLIVAGCGDEDDGTDQQSTAAVTRDCPDFDFNITEVTATGIECDELATLLERELGPISRRFSLAEFDCERESGNRHGGTWRCSDGEREFSFDFGD